MIEVTFRPIPLWPHKPTAQRRSAYTFKAGWSNTLELLSREVENLHGSNIVIGGGWREQDIRQDGMPRANAREPSHPGVEVSFDARIAGRRQRLQYGTDVCQLWQHNVRSIALGLKSLRAVDRYGITRHGEQYAGFKELTTGSGPAPAISRGLALIAEYGTVAAALRATHPDTRDPAAMYTDVDFESVQLARQAA
jgi:hypothetical protein